MRLFNEFSTQGNDQVRFEMTYYALYPGVQVGSNIECILHEVTFAVYAMYVTLKSHGN